MIYMYNGEMIYLKKRLETLIENEKIFVVFEDNVVLVFIILYEKIIVDIEPLLDKKYLVIDTLAIDEKYRRQGIETRLLEFAESIALENVYTDLYLTVNE